MTVVYICIFKFKQLTNTEKVKELKKVCLFVIHIRETLV